MIPRFKQHAAVTYWFYSIVCVAIFSSTHAFFDNRFFAPSLDMKPRMADHTCMRWYAQPFLLTANNGFDSNGHSNDIGLFNLGHFYDDRELIATLQDTNRLTTSPLPTTLQGVATTLPYSMQGRLEVQGVAVGGEYQMHDHVACGFRWSCMHATSRMALRREFEGLTQNKLTDAERYEVQDVQQQIHEALGIESLLWSNTGSGDAEVYASLYSGGAYRYRCRYLKASLSGGLILPFADERDYDYPSSFSFGGDGHFGGYLEGALEATLKYDLRAGCRLRAQRRASNVRQRRVSADNEPERFGAIVGDIGISPGFTLAFAPYAMVEGLRGGLGAQVGFTLVKHFKDDYCDRRQNAADRIAMKKLEHASEWASEHLTAGFFYDFSYASPRCETRPIVSLSVDAPTEFLIMRRVSKTYGISAMVEVDF